MFNIEIQTFVFLVHHEVVSIQKIPVTNDQSLNVDACFSKQNAIAKRKRRLKDLIKCLPWILPFLMV